MATINFETLPGALIPCYEKKMNTKYSDVILEINVSYSPKTVVFTDIQSFLSLE